MLTLHFVPYEEIKNLSSEQRVDTLLKYVKNNLIVILDGKLTKDEEVDLIKRTMEEVSSKFKGIELQVWDSEAKSRSFFENLKLKIATFLAPQLHAGFTIIGPANIIKEIKKDPGKIQLITQSNFGSAGVGNSSSAKGKKKARRRV